MRMSGFVRELVVLVVSMELVMLRVYHRKVLLSVADGRVVGDEAGVGDVGWERVDKTRQEIAKK